jgi:hypothetical protein
MKTREEFIALFESIDFEKIIDHPNILIAANFWDEERYQAARTCYRFMRTLDDLIDITRLSTTVLPRRKKDSLRTI